MVRHCLQLTKDTSVGYVHANIKDGGLEVPCFTTSIPLLQASQREKTASHPTMLFQMMQHQNAFSLLRHWMNQPCRVNTAGVTMKAEVREEWKKVILTSSDNRVLGVLKIDAASHDWLLRPSRVFLHLCLRGMQLRSGILPTRAWNARGANQQIIDKSCRGGCRAPKMINYVLNICEVTHDVPNTTTSYSTWTNPCANKASA